MEPASSHGPGPTTTPAPGTPRVGGLQVKNTFIDCASPWQLERGDLPKKSNSDPGSSSRSTESSAASSEIGTSGSEAEGPSREERMRRMIEAKGVESKRPGDQGHGQGTCRPCKYWVKKAGCQAGESCGFCHLSHDAGHPGMKWRPCRAKRKRYNRLLERLETQVEAKHGQIDLSAVELPPSIEGNAFLKDKVRRKLQQTLLQSQPPPPPAPAPRAAGAAESSRSSSELRAPPGPCSEDYVVLDAAAPLEFGMVYRL